ncbi:MAG: hypothetical protein AAF618_12175, partial [Pseudomonadota bacterium]
MSEGFLQVLGLLRWSYPSALDAFQTLGRIERGPQSLHRRRLDLKGVERGRIGPAQEAEHLEKALA